MAVTAPTPISALPSAPSIGNPASFDTLADSFIAALPTFRTESNTLATNVYNNAVDVSNNLAILNGLVYNTLSTYTVISTDHTIIQTVTASTYTLPSASTNTGRRLHIVNQFAGAINSASSNVIPLIGGAAGTSILPATIGKFITLQSNGSNWATILAN